MQKFYLLLPFLTATLFLSAQTASPTLAVYLDDNNPPLDTTYLQTEVRFVDFVRDRRLSDVQVFSVEEPVGNDAMRYTYYFVGYQSFTGQQDTVVWHADPGENPGSRREKSLRAFKRGLLPYLLQTPLASTIDYQLNAAPDYLATPDPWKLVTFRANLQGFAYGGSFRDNNPVSGEIDIRENNWQFSPSLAVWRIGELWRLGYESRYLIIGVDNSSSAGGAFVNQSRSYHLYQSAHIVRSLGQHWSAGVGLDAAKRNFSVTVMDFWNFDAAIGVEYNLFPYRDYFKRRLTLGYYVDLQVYSSIQYFDYGNAREYAHELYANYAKIGRWGYLNAALSASLRPGHFWALYGTSARVETAVNLGKGLFLRLNAGYTFGNNDYGLLARAAPGTITSLLSRNVRSANYSSSIGLAYYFGSGYRSIVNPRLRQMTDIRDLQGF